MSRAPVLTGLCLCLGLLASAQAAPMRWAEIRDTNLYLQPARYRCLEGRINFEVPSETLFALTWSTS